jgi:hypothetical protein
MSAVIAEDKKAKPGAEAEAGGVVCLIDLGEHSRKRIKKLRRGNGRLMDKVEDAVADLKEEGVLSPTADTVVVIVRQEFSVRGMFDDEDDDD